MHRILKVCLSLAITASAGTAAAQVGRVVDTETGYTVEFRDGNLLGESMGTVGFVIPILDTKARVLLIRPRASFVSELTRSVEDM